MLIFFINQGSYRGTTTPAKKKTIYGQFESVNAEWDNKTIRALNHVETIRSILNKHVPSYGTDSSMHSSYL